MLSEEFFMTHFSGFQIKDVAMRSDGVFNFLIRNVAQADEADAATESDVDKRWVVFAPNLRTNNIGHKWFEGHALFCLCVSETPKVKGVCISSSGKVFVGGGGEFEKEEIPMSIDGPRRGAIRRARMIQGVAYAVGGGHTVCRRRGSSDWESLCLNLPTPTREGRGDKKKAVDMAFEDIDGFSHDDLYAVAGRGVVWHCNGAAWRHIPFPSNMFLESVCCAADGHVYIGAQSGALFRGRGDQWQMIHRGGMALPFKDIVWHANQLWCTSDYGLWTVNGDDVEEVELPSEIKVCSGNLSAAAGMMLMGGEHGAAFHDGKTWQLIFNQYAMEQAIEKAR